MKYHLNPNGEVRTCTAKIKCKYGSEAEHYPSEELALKAYENKMKTLLMTKVVKTESGLYTPIRLGEVLDIELLKNMMSQKMINSSNHNDDDTLTILTYSPIAQNTGTWNEATKIARGLIVQHSDSSYEDAVIVQRPWRKFFTIEQVSKGDGGSAWALTDDDENSNAVEAKLANLDFDSPAEVTDKLDGSLGILYRDPKGLPAFSTKGSFHSDPAIMFTKILRKNDTALEAVNTLLNSHPDTTFTFELIGKDNQIVVNYDENEPRLIGAIKKNTGVYESITKYSTIWSEDKGLKTTEIMPAKTVNEAFKLADREGQEGVVVRVLSDDPDNQIMLKIKQDDYKKMHRLTTGFSYKDSREIIRNLPMNVDTLLNLAETKNIENISEIKEVIDIPISSGFNTDNLNGQRREKFEQALLPEALKFKKAYDLVTSYSIDELKAPGFAREFYEKVSKDESISSLAPIMARTLSQGRGLDTLNFAPLLRSAAEKIKKTNMKGE